MERNRRKLLVARSNICHKLCKLEIIKDSVGYPERYSRKADVSFPKQLALSRRVADASLAQLAQRVNNTAARTRIMRIEKLTKDKAMSGISVIYTDARCHVLGRASYDSSYNIVQPRSHFP